MPLVLGPQSMHLVLGPQSPTQLVLGPHSPPDIFKSMPARHLYIHVPFCARRCSYCDFSIAVRSVTPIDEYLGALRTELTQVAQRDDATSQNRRITGRAVRDALETVYLGGGTPSRLGGAGIASVLASVRDHWQMARGAEITVEANPDDI